MSDAEIVGVIIAAALAPPALVFVFVVLVPRRWITAAQVTSAVPALLYLFVVFGSAFLPGPKGNSDDNAGGAAAVILLPVLGAWLGLIWGAAYAAAWLRGVRPGRTTEGKART